MKFFFQDLQKTIISLIKVSEWKAINSSFIDSLSLSAAFQNKCYWFISSRICNNNSDCFKSFIKKVVKFQKDFDI